MLAWYIYLLINFFPKAGDPVKGNNAGGIPKSLKKLFDDLKNSSNAKQLTVGAVGGWATGYLAAKFGKIVATAIGGSLLLIQVLERKQFGFKTGLNRILFSDCQVQWLHRDRLEKV